MVDELLRTLRMDLEHALQESNPQRPLDSLEVTVAMAVLAGHGLDCSDTEPSKPNTIEGWVSWAEQYSRTS